MRYEQLKSIVKTELQNCPQGLTWRELRERAHLDYRVLCPEWVKQLENEIGLVRNPGKTRAYVWKLRSGRKR